MMKINHKKKLNFVCKILCEGVLEIYSTYLEMLRKWKRKIMWINYLGKRSDDDNEKIKYCQKTAVTTQIQKIGYGKMRIRKCCLLVCVWTRC